MGKLQNHVNLINFEPNTEPKSNQKSELIGYVFRNNEGNRQFQVKTNAFTFNVLHPYNDWEEHFKCFHTFWVLFNQMFQPKSLNRIALRYINKIDLPLPFENFQDYITNIPPIPKCLPQAFAHFFLQMQVPSQVENVEVIISETFEPQSDNFLPFILDIDVFQISEIDSESIIKDFNTLRNIKNSVFENCITEQTRQLIK
jgi:uncharacterized protein (TIGR04255 family)